MSQDSTLPSYTELTTILQKIQPNCHVSQIHGLLCGYVCVTIGDVIDFWHTVFPGVKKSRKGDAILRELYESTYHELSEFSFEFTLLLPDDDSNINERAESLGLWCQGFLTGLEQLDISAYTVNNPEFKEALDDVIAIAQLTFGDIASNEEDEAAYFELVEYVRLSVLMIFHELKKDLLQPDKEADGDVLF
jgi:uncharacterized protein YgfB (UPF0149 family)